MKSLLRLPLLGKVFQDRNILLEERDALMSRLKIFGAFPPGHFYSPIPSQEDIKEHKIHQLPGIDLNISEQKKILERISPFLSQTPFPKKKKKSFRYYYENASFASYDADHLYALMRLIKPKRIIEVGSGFSSAVMLDTNDRYFHGEIDITCIEPYSKLLKSLLFPKDKITIIEQKIQNVPLSTFSSLKKDDILFIDSTHVSKVSSDVNHLFFQVLPSLKKGVYIHIHDVFTGFEYPKHWLEKGIFWNEDYLLHAFLQYNSAFQIQFFSNFIEDNPHIAGASFWMKKIA